MIAAWRMYSTVIPHDACIVLSSCMMHVLYCHPARCMYCTVIPHDSTRNLIASAVRFFIYIVRWQPWNGLQGYWNARSYWNSHRRKNKKTSDFGLTLNYRFGKVSMLAETVYFLRKNSINLSTFCGKESINLSTFSRKRPTVCYFFTKTLQTLQTLHIRE